MAATAGSCLDVYDTRGATRAISEFVDDLSQWWLRASRRRLSRGDDATDRDAAFGTLHLALMAVARTIAPILPFLAEEFHQVLVAPTAEDAPESVHLTAWPAPDLAPLRDEALEAAMADLRRAVELGRTLRSQAGIKVRQPLGTLWLAMPADWPTDEQRRRAPGAAGRGAERQDRGGHRRRVRPRRPAREAAAAGHRQEVRRSRSRPSWPPLAPTRSSTTTTAR